MTRPGGKRRVPWLRALLFLGCVALPLPAAADYRTVDVDGLRITFDSVWGPRSAPGYLPVRFDITNLDGDARAIEIVAQGSRFLRRSRGGAVAASSVRQVVRLARGDRVRLTIPVPVFADSENFQFQIREANRTLERFSANVQSNVAADDASVLIVADMATTLTPTAWLRTTPGTSAPSTMVVTPSGPVSTPAVPPMGPLLDVLLDPTRLPTNWLGYTSLRAVVIGPLQWEQLADAQKDALITWIASGGDLILIDGDVRALGLPEHVLADSSAKPNVRRYFFGRIHLVTAASIDQGGLGSTLVDVRPARDPFWALPANAAPDWGTFGARGFRLEIPGIEGVPARAYLFILLLFSVLIGPVNYWLLRRARQHILVVLTAPLIAVVFIVLLAGYAVAVEGFAVYGRAVTFTMLDQVNRLASTRASVSLYAAGIMPAEGLQFSRDLAVFSRGTDGSGTRERLALDLTDAQRFTAGVLPARSPANFDQIGHRPARERLSFSAGTEGITVVNGLGARVDALLYRDRDRVYSLEQPLPSGSKAVLTAAARRLLPDDRSPGAKFVALVEAQPVGSFLAVLDRSPFWELGVPEVVERGSFHLVLGLTEGGR